MNDCYFLDPQGIWHWTENGWVLISEQILGQEAKAE